MHVYCDSNQKYPCVLYPYLINLMQASEYGEKCPVDPMLPAAGIKSLPGKGYSVIGHE
jgi:hypothetical protein